MHDDLKSNYKKLKTKSQQKSNSLQEETSQVQISFSDNQLSHES